MALRPGRTDNVRKFIRRFLRRPLPPAAPEHAVIVDFFDFPMPDLSPLFALEEQLESAISSADVGEYDGNEIAVDGADGQLFMYGSDADALFAVVRPILESSPLMNGARATLRYGPPEEGVREVVVALENRVE